MIAGESVGAREPAPAAGRPARKALARRQFPFPSFPDSTESLLKKRGQRGGLTASPKRPTLRQRTTRVACSSPRLVKMPYRHPTPRRMAMHGYTEISVRAKSRYFCRYRTDWHIWRSSVRLRDDSSARGAWFASLTVGASDWPGSCHQCAQACQRFARRRLSLALPNALEFCLNLFGFAWTSLAAKPGA